MRHMRTPRAERGLSLVEVTMIVLVLTVLSGVMAPAVMESVYDARFVRVKEDCEAIGVSLARMVVDTGSCVLLDGRLPCTTANRVNLLFSEGHSVQVRGAGAEMFNYELDTYFSAAEYSSSYSLTNYIRREVFSDTRWNIATRLGGSTAFTTAIRSTDDLQLMANTYQDELRGLLRKAEVDYPESAIDTLASISLMEGQERPCSETEPSNHGALRCTMDPGLKMLWMVYRPNAAMNNRTADLLYNVQWSGEKMNAYVFNVETAGIRYTYLIPEVCGNLALLEIADREDRQIATQKAERSIYVQRETIGWSSVYGVDRTVDMLENHLVQNLPSGLMMNGYRYPSAINGGYGLSMGMGWRGAYLASVGADPWGNHYMVNSIFLSNQNNQWPYNTVCISAGADGIVETPFAVAGTKRVGDDFTYVISGRSQ